tara:strand:- start:326 stop:682 length:357 start_codon:yes stop_codon:yes gene_type:complete
MGPEQRIYSQGELYAGSTWGITGYNRRGRPRYGHLPLDPGWVQRSNELYHPKPKPEPPKPAQQTDATIAAAGENVRRPKESKRKKTTLASLRIRPKSKINQQVGGLGGGSGLNIGGYA